MRGGKYSIVEDGAMVADDGVITWLGATSSLDARLRHDAGGGVVDARGALVTPGLIDCHTHLVYAGNRARSCLPAGPATCWSNGTTRA